MKNKQHLKGFPGYYYDEKSGKVKEYLLHRVFCIPSTLIAVMIDMPVIYIRMYREGSLNIQSIVEDVAAKWIKLYERLGMVKVLFIETVINLIVWGALITLVVHYIKGS